MRRELGRRLPTSLREGLKSTTASAYARVNVDTARSGRTRDEIDMIAELDQYFEPLNERLAALTALDLSAWHEGASESGEDASPA